MPFGVARAGQTRAKTAAPGFAANPVNFDGTNDNLELAAALTGIADGPIILFSGWGKTPASTLSERRIFSILAGTSSRFFVAIDSTAGSLRITGRNSSGTIVLDATGPDIDTNAWRHIAISIDLASASNRRVFIDGADATGSVTWATYDTSGVMDLNPSSSPECVIGMYTDANPNRWSGDLAEIYFTTPASYFDLTVGANLAKFISAGAPVGLGSSGQNPTGTSALVLLSGATASWHTNKGTGGGFTEVGALTDGSSPVEI